MLHLNTKTQKNVLCRMVSHVQPQFFLFVFCFSCHFLYFRGWDGGFTGHDQKYFLCGRFILSSNFPSSALCKWILLLQPSFILNIVCYTVIPILIAKVCWIGSNYCQINDKRRVTPSIPFAITAWLVVTVKKYSSYSTSTITKMERERSRVNAE